MTNSLIVTPINAQETQAWLISTATAPELVIALNTVAPLGWRGTVTSYVQPNSNNTVIWDITLSKSGFANLNGTNGCWIVSDGDHVDILVNTDFIAAYTANVALVWAAISTPPVVEPAANGTAVVTTSAPTSPNGPWTYSLDLTDTTSSGVTTVSDQPTLANGILTWNLAGLTVGDEYTVTLSVDTQYDGVSANSVPSSTFTAIA
jgi:hypothetical protein